MTTRLAINGFGRIGAAGAAARWRNKAATIWKLSPSTIWDRSEQHRPSSAALTAVHGRFPTDVTVGDGTIDVGRGPIKITAERDPRQPAMG